MISPSPVWKYVSKVKESICYYINIANFAQHDNTLDIVSGSFAICQFAKGYSEFKAGVFQ
jgi:hypothetical protein